MTGFSLQSSRQNFTKITNIQLDIDEIDDEIEEIMEVQSSNNNADISELENEQEEIHVVKNINELAG